MARFRRFPSESNGDSFIMLELALIFASLRPEMFAPRLELALQSKGPLRCEALMLSHEGIQALEPCLWRIAQNEMIERLPGYAIAITRMQRPKVEYRRKGKNDPFGKAEEKHPDRVKVFLTNDALEDSDSIRHEFAHTIVYRLNMGGLVKWALNNWVDMAQPGWITRDVVYVRRGK